MLNCFQKSRTKNSVPLILLPENEFKAWIKKQTEKTKAWLKTHAFKAKPTTFCVMMSAKGELQSVYVGVQSLTDIWAIAHLPFKLPRANYYVANKLSSQILEQLAVGWALGAYQFTRFKKHPKKPAKLSLSKEIDLSRIENIVDAIYLVRDLINLPTDNLGPSELSAQLFQLAETHGALFSEIVGDALLDDNLAAIHTVGRASDDAPRLLELMWGNSSHPHIAIVGKGVCFDTGGLDIKSASGMKYMKKDMAGAAHAIALAKMIMQANLPIHLHLLVPTVENVIAGNAYHPGDVITMRDGTTVEVTNTDAEGRLILADALAKAVEEDPDFLIDFASLTGAARVALGPELPAIFSNHDILAESLCYIGDEIQDPAWRMPLYQSYRRMLKSDIADITNASSEPYGGAITAALFLQTFVPDDIDWIHVDLMGMNQAPKPGRPRGGEAQLLRAVFLLLSSGDVI